VRYLNLFLALLFLFGALVQINDPDPIGWIAIYLAAAGACLAAHRRPERLAPPLIVGVIALVWAGAILSGMESRVPLLNLFSQWQMMNQAVENTRESYGLLIIAGWMAVLGARAFRARKRDLGASAPAPSVQRV
jgi:hypothetical protein